jgi:hypothetical protein
MLKSPADLFSDTLHVILKILMDKLSTWVIRHVKKIVTKICQLKCIWESTCILSLLNSFTLQSAWGHNLFLVIFPVVKFLSMVLPLIPTIISLSHLYLLIFQAARTHNFLSADVLLYLCNLLSIRSF